MSKAKPLFFGKVSGGKIAWDDEEKLLIWLGTLEGKEIEATIAPLSFQRTLPQNKRYWGYIIEEIALSTGHSKEEIHEIMKSKFNRGMVELKGKQYEVVKSTTELDVKEFMDYCDRVQAWASQELGIQFIEDVDL